MQIINEETKKNGTKCDVCGKRRVKTKADYQYTESGLTNVTLSGISIYKCKCQKVVPALLNTEKLNWFISLALLEKPTILSGREFRFLRRFACAEPGVIRSFLTAEVAERRRWEKLDVKISPRDDSDIRQMYLWTMFGRYEMMICAMKGRPLYRTSMKQVKKLMDSGFKRAFESAKPRLMRVRDSLEHRKKDTSRAWRYQFIFKKGPWQSWKYQRRIAAESQ